MRLTLTWTAGCGRAEVYKGLRALHAASQCEELALFQLGSSHIFHLKGDGIKFDILIFTMAVTYLISSSHQLCPQPPSTLDSLHRP